ncbi:MAG: hypothetical protein Q8R59_16820, partial [Polaromonas sp.]|nr:hypothetical protein [Polaromonas sp.]
MSDSGLHSWRGVAEQSRTPFSNDRQVSRLVHSICGHRCHDTSKIYLGRQGTQAFEFQSFSAGECPSCAILGFWRAHVGSLFAIKAFIKEAGNVGWRGDSWEGWNFSELVQRNLLPVRVLSS